MEFGVDRCPVCRLRWKIYCSVPARRGQFWIREVAVIQDPTTRNGSGNGNRGLCMRLLVVEDNATVANQIKAVFERELYVVDITPDGRNGWFLGDTEEYDAVVLDLGLPGLDGLSVLQNWRSNGNEVPVLILTSRDTWREKVTGLRAGADDYLAKPFQPEELLARVEVLVRRASGRATPVLKCGSIEIDPVRAQVKVQGRQIDLTAQEYRVLQYLIQKRPKVISRAELSEHIYGKECDHDSNVIEVVINHLRNKLDPSLITTRRGLGYQIEDAGDDG
jgi:two-component system OmpR family response regulator